MKVSVLVLHYGDPEPTLRALEALGRTEHPLFRVDVWLNGGGDVSLWKERGEERIASGRNLPSSREGQNPWTEHELFVAAHPRNLGFAGGLNPAIRKALDDGADGVWLLNNDARPEPEALGSMVALLKRESSVGLVGSIVCDDDDEKRIQSWGGGWLTPFLKRDRTATSKRPLDYITGASLLVRREVFQGVGLLDDGFFFYWEDVEFSLRARSAGWKIAVAEGSRVYHAGGSSVGKRSLDSDTHRLRSYVHFLEKSRPPLRRLRLLLTLGAMIVLRIRRGQGERILPLVRVALEKKRP